MWCFLRVDARKKHKCIRGCRINEGDTYFVYEIGAGWGNDWKFCAGCMAMILYFKDVDKLPPSPYTHWNVEKQEPVRVKEK